MNTGSESHSSDSDAWRSRSTDGLKNGDDISSSLAAKGFRSVRPNLQDKKSPTQGSPPYPGARHSPYHRYSAETPDCLVGLQALSPTPYALSQYATAECGRADRTDKIAWVSVGAVHDAGNSRSMAEAPSPSLSPETVSALSHYSTSTAGLLEELQICSLDSPGASPTPSPTLSHTSASASISGTDEALTSATAAAAATNVTMPTATPTNCWLPTKILSVSHPKLTTVKQSDVLKLTNLLTCLVQVCATIVNTPFTLF